MIPGLEPRQRTADLSGQALTLDQMEYLGRQRTLVGLQLDGCPIGDEHVRAICGLPRLVNLSLSGTQLTDAALEHLARLPKLQLLFLAGTRIRGEGLRHLAKSQKLQVLWLDATDVTDETIGLAAALPKLSTLRIAKTRVTFAGLLSLAGNERLRVIADDQFTAAEMARFEAARRDAARGARGKGEASAEDEAAAKKTLLAFFEELDAWERSLTAAQKKGAPIFTPGDKAACAAIFARYCTKAAQGGARSRPFGEPPEHDGETVVGSESVSKTKLWLYTKGKAGESRYLLARGPDSWQIEKRQWKGDGWERRWL
jgi:hypothetical protein